MGNFRTTWAGLTCLTSLWVFAGCGSPDAAVVGPSNAPSDVAGADGSSLKDGAGADSMPEPVDALAADVGPEVDAAPAEVDAAPVDIAVDASMDVSVDVPVMPPECLADADCTSANGCATAGCQGGKCVSVAKTNGSACDDGNACTTEDACQSGACLPGAATVCDDTNPCTTDSCDPKTGCAYLANTVACSDGSACSVGDSCLAGVCKPGPAPDCSDGNPCTVDACDVNAGCTHTAGAIACSDGNACTIGDACSAGTCLPGSPTACDDGNPCTTDSCDPTVVSAAKACVNTGNSLACSDGDVCTLGDTCQQAACQAGKALACSDGNPCTDDACDSKSGCTFTANSVACNDQNVCTLEDVCKGGQCVPGKPSVCEDGNPCTSETCDSGQGCKNVGNTLPCDDGDACSQGDACTNGACAGGKAIACNDSNPCTDDSCVPKQGCVFTVSQATCSDGNACTVADACKDGNCLAGKPVGCDDGNACTTDSCDPASGCKSVPGTQPCDDGSVCTVGDACSGGACVAGSSIVCSDGNACTTDSCDAAKGCTATANDAPCDDGNACSAKDVCALGKCTGAKVSCDDANPCTSDFCDSTSGCANVGPAGWGACGTQCLDLQNDVKHCGVCTKACASNELCQQGACQAIVCIPNGVEACYSGAAGTSGVGPCTPGKRTCNAQGTAFATACVGEVAPLTAEDCNTPVDDDCNGKTNEAAACGIAVYRFNAATDCGQYCYHDEAHNIAINGVGQGGNTKGFNQFEGGQLLDGIKGKDDWSANNGSGHAQEWVGWSSKEAQVDFKFPKPRVLQFVRLGLDNYGYGGVYEPPEVRVSFSDDGVKWSAPTVYKLSDGTLPSIAANKRADITVKFPAKTSQYIAVRFINSSWTFVDEVAFD